MLTNEQKQLYARQLLIPDFTEDDQKKIIDSKILVIGAGGLGSPVLIYLIAAGIRTIGIVEFDKVSLSNLNRQILYSFDDIGKHKATLASKKIRKQNPNVKPKLFQTKWSDENAKEIAKNYDLIIDCSDNTESRIITDSISQHFVIPFIFGAISNWEGQVSVFNYKGSKSYKESFDIAEAKVNPPQLRGVIGVVPAVTGSIMAAEAIKIIIDKGDVLVGKLLHFSLLTNNWKIFNL